MRARHRQLARSLWWALPLLSGCSLESSFVDQDDLVRDPVVIEESFVQEPLPKVDILWVIDNTPSMADEQAALAGAMGSFTNALSQLGLAWQAGVVTTTVNGPDAGRLQGDPWILTSDVLDLEAALAALTSVGTDEDAEEAGLGAAFLALTEPLRSGDNRAFRRDDAVLHVVVLSDGDDESEDVLGEDPVTMFTTFLREEGERTVPTARLSAVVGDPGAGCAWEGGTAGPGDRYAEVVEASGGVLASICAADLSSVAEAIGEASLSWPDTFPLSAAPAPDSVRVSVDGERLDEGWTLDEEAPAVVFDAPPAAGAEIAVRYEVAS